MNNSTLQINKKIGIFIDGDNAYEKTFNILINHIKKCGKIIINRVYGNFSKKSIEKKWNVPVSYFEKGPIRWFIDWKKNELLTQIKNKSL